MEAQLGTLQISVLTPFSYNTTDEGTVCTVTPIIGNEPFETIATMGVTTNIIVIRVSGACGDRKC